MGRSKKDPLHPRGRGRAKPRSLANRETRLADLPACRRALARLFSEIARDQIEPKKGQAMVACVRGAIEIHRFLVNRVTDERLRALEEKAGIHFEEPESKSKTMVSFETPESKASHAVPGVAA